MDTTKKCLVCEAQNYEPLYNNTLLKCSSCGFVTANMSISENDLQKIYTKNYFAGEEYLDYLNDKPIIQHNFKRRVDYILKKVNGATIKNALEIGCAYGFFAEVLLNRLPHTTYKGFDISDDATRYAREVLKIDANSTDYLTDKPQVTYTDAFMWDVIEHLREPQLFISKIHSELQTGGHIYITTGDIASLMARFKKQNWRLIHPPSHLHYFSVDTITKLLQNTGFRVIDVSYPLLWRSVRQIFYSLFILNKPASKILHKIHTIIPESFRFPLNTFDIMFVVAEKV